MPPHAGVIEAAIDAIARAGIDLDALGLAWARVMPAVTLVPAFGLRALPAPARAVMGLALAASIAPALAPVAAETALPWAVRALAEVARGLPVAIAAAVPLWAATMAGGVADALRGSQDSPSAPAVEGRPTALGVPLSLLASALFLASGGPARVAMALAVHPVGPHPLLAAAEDLAAGIGFAVALAGPLLGASVVVEVAAALVARAATPAQVHALLAPMRAIALLAVMAFAFERMATILADVVRATG